MRRETVVVGEFEVNCSVIELDGKVYVVDPGAEAERICRAIDGFGKAPDGILLTHAHFDHIGAIPALQERYPGLAVYIHPEDAKLITHPMNAFPPCYPAIAMPKDIRDCRVVEGMAVIETPGHTPGGVSYYFAAEGLLLSGDTLFRGSYGRTDLPGGDYGTLMRSLARLRKLPGETLVVPGHGPTTTIGEEQ